VIQVLAERTAHQRRVDATSKLLFDQLGYPEYDSPEDWHLQLAEKIVTTIEGI
jgi:hypothetical protein